MKALPMAAHNQLNLIKDVNDTTRSRKKKQINHKCDSGGVLNSVPLFVCFLKDARVMMSTN